MQNANFLIENNAKHYWHPMASPGEMLKNPPKIITSAEGVTLTDVNGHKTLDAVGGLWNVNLGYSCQPVKDAIRDQLEVLPYYTSFRGTSNGPAIELAYVLRERFAPDGLSRAFFTSGGSDSVDTALRLARQYFKIRGERDRTKFISVKKGYHGTHFGGASVNGNPNIRRNFEPLLQGCFQIPCPYVYRNPFNETDPEILAQLCAAALDDEITFQGPDTVAAFIMEPVLGAGGIIPPHESFYPMAREICDRHGVLFIADEVITAFGRTGAWSGSQLWGVQPDMMCVAKAITNGFFPLGATLISEKIAETFESNDDAFGVIGHGYTNSANPVGAAAALAALKETDRLNVVQNAAVRGTELLAACQELESRHKFIGNVRGKGLMVGLELVGDRKEKTPLGKDIVGKIFEAIYAQGVMVRIAANNLLLSPSLIITADDVNTIVSAIDAGLTSAE